MEFQTILTPYFLDTPLPELDGLAGPDWQINTVILPEARVMARLAALHRALANKVTTSVEAGYLPVSIAGDCCAAIGILAGLRRSGIDPYLIWFDAHGDFNTWETTPSGFLGGMPLAMLAGVGDQTILEILELDPLSQDQILLTDGRDLDPGERELVNGSEITHLQDPEALLDFPLPDRPLWIHFDTDILDPEYVPAQNYPAPGGISPERLRRIFTHLADTGRVRGVSMSTWAPQLPGAAESAAVCLELLFPFSGQIGKNDQTRVGN